MVWQSSTYKIVKVIKLFKQLAQRILGEFVIIIIYLYNYYYYYYYYIIISRICSISTTTVLRSLHLWPETSVNVLFKNFAADSGSIRAIREYNILLLIPAITERKCNQLDRNILALPVRWPGPEKPVPWSKARIRFVNQSNKAPCWTNRIWVTSVTRRFPHKNQHNRK